MRLLLSRRAGGVRSNRCARNLVFDDLARCTCARDELVHRTPHAAPARTRLESTSVEVTHPSRRERGRFPFRVEQPPGTLDKPQAVA
jgi:hypothetical protein